MVDTEYDLVIRNGRVVDGTGLPSFKGDVAIKDGLVAALGSNLSGHGKEEIDATGLVVAPGFMDVHTHYDAQLNWDPYASQSCWHGVTSVVVSNCGFGFAPCRPEGRERAMLRMTRVEAIPYEAMKLGMRWDWVSQREYLASLERAGIGVNVAAYIPHSAVRTYVLGEEDTTRVDVTDDELEQMKELVRDGYRAGALGLSTDHNLINRDYDGSVLPSVVARREETKALLAVAREFNVGSIEVSPDNIHVGPEQIAVFEEYAEASGRPIYYTALVQSYHVGDAWRRSLELIEEANKRHRIFAMGIVHRQETLFNLIEYNLFDEMPAWNAALACPMEQRLANLRDPAVRAKLQHDLDHYLNRIWSGRWDKMRVFKSAQEGIEGKYLIDIAKERGVTPLDAFLDIALGEELKTYFYIEDQVNDDNDANRAILRNPYVIPGASDGGAHTAFMCMGKYPTIVLSRWVRDEGVISLEEAHWKLSKMPALAVGLENIGTLERGMPADIVVYDLDKLAVTPEDPVYDPVLGGGRRLIQKAVGYHRIIVNGVVTFKDGECTGALPGRVLRSGAYEPSLEAEDRPIAAE